MPNYYSKKVCKFCLDKCENIDYKDVKLLQKYLSGFGKIEPRKFTGTCVSHQRKVAVALKRARIMALLPFVNR